MNRIENTRAHSHLDSELIILNKSEVPGPNIRSKSEKDLGRMGI